MRTALLDADIIIWKAAAIGTTTDEDGVQHCDWNKSWHIANAMVTRWAAAVQADQLVFCVTDRNAGCQSFRFKVAEDYHANRKDMVRPEVLLRLHWEMVDKYAGMFHPGLEGDDILGILATSGEYEDPVIVTEDKDLLGVPGQSWSPTRSTKVQVTDLVSANRYWFAQSMIGDPADGYRGCKGVGKAKTKALLAGVKSVEEMWKRTLATFLAHGHTEADAIQQLRLARILRAEDLDNWERVRLWHPKEPEWLSLPEPVGVPSSYDDLAY